MKKIILILVILVGIGLLVLNYKSTPTDVDLASVNDIQNDVPGDTDQNNELKYTFTDFDFVFTGFGPAGKKHDGVMDFEISENKINFIMNTVKTDNETVDEHLCTDDFFNCAQFPISHFTLTSAARISETESQISGIYEMKGITKNVSFNATVAEGSQNLSDTNNETKFTGEFLLDTADFGFKVPIVEPKVLIKFNFSLKAEKTASISETTNVTSTTTTTTTTTSSTDSD